LLVKGGKCENFSRTSAFEECLLSARSKERFWHLGLTNGLCLKGSRLLACPSLTVGVILLQSLGKDTKGTAPVQLLGRSNWILGLKVFVECISPTGFFWIVCAIYIYVDVLIPSIRLVHVARF